MFSAKKRRFVGLEVDEGEARAVELHGGPRTPVLEAWGRVPLSPGVFAEGTVADPEALGAALKQLWLTAGIGCREIILGVANKGVLVRTATFPKVPESKVSQMIRYQAQDYLPVPIHSVVLGHAVTREVSAEGKQLLEILLVAVRRDMLEPYFSALAEARLTIRDIHVSTLVLRRLLPPENKNGTYALLNVANGLSHLLITEGDVPRLARLIPAGLHDVAVFSKDLRDDAVTALNDRSISISSEAFRAWAEGLWEDLINSFSYYQGQPNTKPPEKIILSGPGAKMPGLAQWLSESTALPVVAAEPLEGIILPPEKEKSAAGEANDFAVCFCLARCGLEG